MACVPTLSTSAPWADITDNHDSHSEMGSSHRIALYMGLQEATISQWELASKIKAATMLASRNYLCGCQVLKFYWGEWHIIILPTSTLVYHSPRLYLNTKHYTRTVNRRTQIIPAFPQLILKSLQPHPILLTRSPLSLDLALTHFSLVPLNPNIKTLQVSNRPLANQILVDLS